MSTCEELRYELTCEFEGFGYDHETVGEGLKGNRLQIVDTHDLIISILHRCQNKYARTYNHTFLLPIRTER